MMFNLSLAVFFVLSLLSCQAFRSSSMIRGSRAITRYRLPEVQMGLFDGLFGPKKSASASHILIKGANGPTFLTELKMQLNASKNVKSAFAEAAAQYSSCPSAKKGGALGTFKQGQMVPAFDKVVFNEKVGVIHGPVNTPFGAHLILIDERSD